MLKVKRQKIAMQKVTLEKGEKVKVQDSSGRATERTGTFFVPTSTQIKQG